MPGSRKSFDQFQFDDASCRQYAVQTTGGTPNDAAANAAVGSAVVGTILGAAVGGLIGGSEGAAVGAGMGLFGGSAVGASNAQYASYTTQQRFDNTYYQCMYSQGHKVPMPASYARSTTSGERVPRTRALRQCAAAERSHSAGQRAATERGDSTSERTAAQLRRSLRRTRRRRLSAAIASVSGLAGVFSVQRTVRAGSS